VIAASGKGTSQPFDVSRGTNEGVRVDDDGALVLEAGTGSAAGLIWIANTAEGTVSKVDTASMTELGRYRVPYAEDIDPGENGPSRTSVDSDGNVYVGARKGDSISKVSAAGERCPDTNGDGASTTSSGPGDILALGADDCFIWSTDIASDARGVAVQEIASKFVIENAPDMEPNVREIPGARFVWVGGQDVVKLHKIDAETGAVLFSMVPPTSVYGLAMDGRSNLWLVAQKESAIGRIDTTRCVDANCANETVCVTQCTETSCPTDCDSAIVERIELPQSSYGVTVDCRQRVWLGGAYGGDGVKRYDPLADADKRLSILTGVAEEGERGINGIAADSKGFVWGAGNDSGVWRINADTLDFRQVAGTGGKDFSAKGMAIDRSGRVWAIPLRQEYAMVITPGPTIDDATVEKPIGGFVGPYTYSDMTGEQRRLAANEPGFYRQLFTGCAENVPTNWGELSWDVETPESSYVVFKARTADTPQALEAASWVAIAAAPGRNGPVGLASFFPQGTERYFEIEVRLFPSPPPLGGMPGDLQEARLGCNPEKQLSSPRIKTFGATHSCGSVVE